jgi:hypothetical protein
MPHLSKLFPFRIAAISGFPQQTSSFYFRKGIFEAAVVKKSLHLFAIKSLNTNGKG